MAPANSLLLCALSPCLVTKLQLLESQLGVEAQAVGLGPYKKQWGYMPDGEAHTSPPSARVMHRTRIAIESICAPARDTAACRVLAIEAGGECPGISRGGEPPNPLSCRSRTAGVGGGWPRPAPGRSSHAL